MNERPNFDDVPVQTSESMARRDGQPATMSTVKELLGKRKAQIKALLANQLDPVKFATVAMTTIRTNEKLQKCTPESLVMAVIMAAQRGLSLDPTLGHAYLVPYWNSNLRSFEAQYQTGYQGKIFMAKRDGDVLVDSFVVYEHDRFEITRTAEGDVFTHQPAPLSEDPGEAVGYVARARLEDGRTLFEVMRRADVEKIRDSVKARYKGKETPAWREWFDEMGRGKAVNRLAKYLPQCPMLQVDAAQEAALDAGNAQIVDVEGDDGMLLPIVVPAGALPEDASAPPAGDAPTGAPTTAPTAADAPAASPTGKPAPAAPGAASAASGAISARGALGAYIRDERARCGVTQKALAEGVGMSASTLGRIESGEIRPEPDVVERLAQYLALDPADLLAVGGYTSPPAEPPRGRAPRAEDEPPADLFNLQAEADRRAPADDDK